MAAAESRAKNPQAARHARNAVFYKYIRPGETKGRFRDPAAIAAKEGVIGGEELFG